jgi:hypothetical protein
MMIAAELQHLENGSGVRPISATTRELSKTVSQTRYGMNTFSSDALRPIVPREFDSMLTTEEKFRSRPGQNSGSIFPADSARAWVSWPKVSAPVPEERW